MKTFLADNVRFRSARKQNSVVNDVDDGQIPSCSNTSQPPRAEFDTLKKSMNDIFNDCEKVKEATSILGTFMP